MVPRSESSDGGPREHRLKQPLKQGLARALQWAESAMSAHEPTRPAIIPGRVFQTLLPVDVSAGSSRSMRHCPAPSPRRRLRAIAILRPAHRPHRS
jgi:hypothetical protein